MTPHTSTMPYAPRIEKTFPSRTETLLDVRSFVSNAARQFGFNDEETSNIVLAVDEACTNVIKHAYQFARDKSFVITILRTRTAFEVRIADQGKSFDPDHLQPPDLTHHHGPYRRGGLGVYLMRKLMDRVEYDFTHKRRNEVRLIKFLSGTQPRTGT